MFQPVQKVYIHRMNIPVHHYYDRQANANFSSRYHHYKKKQITCPSVPADAFAAALLK
jgi:hypothetical protein